MVLKNIALAVICLLLGGVIGYQLRSRQQDGAAASDAFHGSALKASAPAAAASRPTEATSASGSPARAGTDLGARMKALLENYNADAARKAVGSLSASEIQAALALLAVLPKSADRDSLRSNLYRAWAKTNPTAAWKAALADPLENEGGSLLAAVAGEMVKTKPEAAVGLVLSLRMGGRREGVFVELLDEWGKVDPAGALAYWNKHPDLPLHYSAIVQVIDRLGEKDPLRAANLALTLTNQQARASAISNLMNNWASHEPTSALSWAQTISNPTLRQSAIVQAISGWSIKDPKAAMTHAQTIKEPGARSSAMQSVWNNWLQKDPAAAMTYTGSSGDENLMGYVGSNFAAWTQGFTQQEKASLLEKFPEGKPKQDIVRSLADSEIRKGRYNQAMELLNDMPDSSDRDVTVQQLGKKWAEADPKAAAEWLKLQPDSSDRDLAVAGFAAVLARTDPQAALEWADTIPDEGVKTGTLKSIALRWLTADPASAESWLVDMTGLSDFEKKSLREAAIEYGPDRISYGVNVSERR